MIKCALQLETFARGNFNNMLLKQVLVQKLKAWKVYVPVLRTSNYHTNNPETENLHNSYGLLLVSLNKND